MDMFELVNNMFAPVINALRNILISLAIIALMAVIAFLAFFFIKYRVNPFRMTEQKLMGKEIKFKPYDFMRWILVDIMRGDSGIFGEYGFTIFCGRQGAGKTISLIEYLNRMKEKYPECVIVTNFYYDKADHRMTDWRDLMEIRNGDNGVIFAIDEIHSEYSSASWKDFPEALLSEISQQRKQKVRIVATSQSFARVAKPIREQAVSVIQCSTYFRRFTKCNEYDAIEYTVCMNNLARLKGKVKRLNKWSFVHSDILRSCYDTYEKIERMKKVDFMARSER